MASLPFPRDVPSMVSVSQMISQFDKHELNIEIRFSSDRIAHLHILVQHTVCDEPAISDYDSNYTEATLIDWFGSMSACIAINAPQYIFHRLSTRVGEQTFTCNIVSLVTSAVALTVGRVECSKVYFQISFLSRHSSSFSHKMLSLYSSVLCQSLLVTLTLAYSHRYTHANAIKCAVFKSTVFFIPDRFLRT